MDTPRSLLTETLQPQLPADWVLIPYQDTLDEMSKVTVMLRQTTLTHHASAPAGLYATAFDALVLAPETDPVAAEDTLDDAVLTFVRLLDTNTTAWTTATKASGLPGTGLGYVVALTIITKKE